MDSRVLLITCCNAVVGGELDCLVQGVSVIERKRHLCACIITPC